MKRPAAALKGEFKRPTAVLEGHFKRTAAVLKGNLKRPAATIMKPSVEEKPLKLLVTQGLSGSHFTVEVGQAWTVLQAKEVLAPFCDVPAREQRLLLGNSELSDSTCLATVLPHEGDSELKSLEIQLIRGMSVTVSEWGGEDTMEPATDGRAGTVWIDSSRSVPLSSVVALKPSEYSSFLAALSEEECLTLVHEQDDFITEWNEVIGEGRSWGRIRRYHKTAIASAGSGSIVYEDAIAIGIADPGNEALPSSSSCICSFIPLVSCFSVQQSVEAARADAWVRVVGVAKYKNISFGILQEYDGVGCVVALRGGELRPLFMVEVLMGFSDALFRGSHAMWVGARYRFFHYRFATWSVSQKSESEPLGPCATSFHACLYEAFTKLGYQPVGVALVHQLERIKDGFASGCQTKLFNDAKLAAEASSAALG